LPTLLVVATRTIKVIEGKPHVETNATVVKHKFGLLNLTGKLGNVSKACKVVGLT